MEAVSAILGSGLRVGILLRGKKIRDDNRTLLQTGISCKESLDNLGFALEPSLQKVNPAIASEDVPLTVPYDMPELLTRCFRVAFKFFQINRQINRLLLNCEYLLERWTCSAIHSSNFLPSFSAVLWKIVYPIRGFLMFHLTHLH